MEKHKPKFETMLIDGQQRKVYHKWEWDDHFWFRASNAVSINANCLTQCDYVLVELMHRGPTIIGALRTEIVAYDDYKSFTIEGKEEGKYYFPVDKWTVLKGEADWWKKLGATPPPASPSGPRQLSLF
jgi:hypothetical protein